MSTEPIKRGFNCREIKELLPDYLEQDLQEALMDNHPVCRPCSGTCYFSHAREVSWPGMNWTPGEASTKSGKPSSADGAHRLAAIH